MKLGIFILTSIVALDSTKGKIKEDGTHSELLAKGGLYKHLWDAQVEGFLGDDQPTPEGFGVTRTTEDEA